MTILFDNDDGIPSSIWIAILSFLNCLDVVRLSTVSKNWYYSIRNPEFVNFYNKFGPEPSREILLQGKSPMKIKNDKILIIISDQFPGNDKQTVLVPHKIIGSKNDYELIGSIRGILCIQRWDQHNRCVFVMSNPLTGQIHETISPTPRKSKGNFFVFLFI